MLQCNLKHPYGWNPYKNLLIHWKNTECWYGENCKRPDCQYCEKKHPIYVRRNVNPLLVEIPNKSIQPRRRY
jgi:hypothetical protein